MKKHFTENAEAALFFAEKIAGKLGHTYIGSEHILLGLASGGSAFSAKILESNSITYDRILDAVKELVGTGCKTSPNGLNLTPRTVRIIENAAEKTVLDDALSIGSEHLLLALIEDSDSVGARIIISLGGSLTDISADITAFLRGYGNGRSKEKRSESSLMKRLPLLSTYGRDLTHLATIGALDPVIGRDTETERIIEILSRRQKNNPCLIGEPGVGKTAVVEGLAARIVSGEVPALLQGKQIVSLDLSAMIAGAKYRGEFEERMKGILSELRKNTDVLLFIDEVHMLSGAGAAEGAIDAANILKPPLSRGELHLIGATTGEEYRKYIEKDAALERRFQPVEVREPTVEETVIILKGLAPRYEEHHKIKISEDALTSAAELSKRYIPDRFLPDKAIDLLDEAAARLRIEKEKHPADVIRLEKDLRATEKKREAFILKQDFSSAAALREEETCLRDAYQKAIKRIEKQEEIPPLLERRHIEAILTSSTGIPIYRLSEDVAMHYESIDRDLSSAIVGQEEAIESVSAAIRRSMAGLRDATRPIASFLFLGPEGVGKTACAKAIAKAVFGSENALIRLDMSEYREAFSVSKLIGSAPGYVGYDDGGKLTERVRKHPYSLILFDEIEKAHSDIYDLLLQILDDGSLTDSHARRVDFRNTVIVMTSNLLKRRGTETTLGFHGTVKSSAEGREDTENALKKHFRSELLNRIDEIVFFSPLSENALNKITEQLLLELRGKLKRHGIELEYTSSVLSYLAHLALLEKNGARPLRRILRRRIEDEIASALLVQKISRGDTVLIDCKEDNISINVKNTVHK